MFFRKTSDYTDYQKDGYRWRNLDKTAIKPFNIIRIYSYINLAPNGNFLKFLLVIIYVPGDRKSIKLLLRRTLVHSELYSTR